MECELSNFVMLAVKEHPIIRGDKKRDTLCYQSFKLTFSVTKLKEFAQVIFFASSLWPPLEVMCSCSRIMSSLTLFSVTPKMFKGNFIEACAM